VLVDEGDVVDAGQLVARMDTEVLQAELREALAEAWYAREARAVAAAEVTQRDSECAYAQKAFDRTLDLFKKDHVAEDRLDQAKSRLEVAEAACVAAEGKVTEAGAAIAAAEAQGRAVAGRARGRGTEGPARQPDPLPAGGARGSAACGRQGAHVDRSRRHHHDRVSADQGGRAQSDGAEARIVLDAVPDRPVLATVSFVASKAQFTPRQVETGEEREKLTFRVKVRALDNPDRLLKPGMPGVAYIKQIDAGPWADRLQFSGAEPS
jgi:HlyD family secretion protein